MNRKERIHGFDFNHQASIRNEIHPISTVQRQSFVANRQRDFFLKGDARQLQFVCYACLICRFQQPGPELPMNFQHQPDHPV